MDHEQLRAISEDLDTVMVIVRHFKNSGIMHLLPDGPPLMKVVATHFVTFFNITMGFIKAFYDLNGFLSSRKEAGMKAAL